MIQFKNPDYLYLLFLVLIPILIHLFQLRKFNKVDFTNVAVLKVLQLQSRKSKKLKKYILLLLRVLTITTLVLAFAQPYIPASNQALKDTNYTIYLDNSFSMQMPSNKGNLLKKAQQELIELVPKNANINLFTNSNSFKNLNSSTFQKELLNIEFTPEELDLENAVRKAEMLSKNEQSLSKIILISDFQSTKPIDYNQLLQNENLSLLQVKPQPKINFSINEIQIDNEKNSLVINLNASQKAEESIQVSIWNKNKLLAKQLVEFKGTQQESLEITLADQEIAFGRIEIEDDALQYDNQFFFSINPIKKINVLSIFEEDNKFLEKIFSKNEFNFTEFSTQNLDYSEIKNSDFIILNGLKYIPTQLQNNLIEFVNNNGSVSIIPSLDADFSSYNTFLNSIDLPRLENRKNNTQKITNINFEHPLLQNVFTKNISNFEYPSTKAHFKIKSNNTPIFSFVNKEAFLVSENKAYLFTSSLNSQNSNFKNSPLVVPTFYNMGRNSVSPTDIFNFTNQAASFQINANLAKDDVIKMQKDEQILIPQQRSYTENTIIKTNELDLEAGTYEVVYQDSIYQFLSFNYPRTESELNYLQNSQLEDKAKLSNINSFFENELRLKEVNQFWKTLLILAILFLILEVLALRYLK